MLIDAIVPAHNESLTIESVIATLRGSKFVRRVIVVDDGSRDVTSCRARNMGATVLRTAKNQGKGAAMRAGFEFSDSPFVGFFDADLLTLRVDHVDKLITTCEAHRLDMACGLRDYGIWNPVQLLGPLITGERVCSRQLLSNICDNGWSGYVIETAMNDAARRMGGRVGCVMLEGLKIRNKTDKQGFISGMRSHWKMAREIGRAERALERSNGRSCT